MKLVLALLFFVLTAPAQANPVQLQLAALTEQQRSGLMQRMLAREGHRCTRVSQTFFQGQDSRGGAYWSVQCDGEQAWQVAFLGAAGEDIRVLSCKVVNALGSRCFRPFK